MILPHKTTEEDSLASDICSLLFFLVLSLGTGIVFFLPPQPRATVSHRFMNNLSMPDII